MRREDETNDAIHLAWRIQQIKVLTQNNHRVPELETLLIGEARQSTQQQMVNALKVLAARTGIPLRVRTKAGESSSG